jgi:16S rRNA G966 N2-methylase RsmD
MAEQQLLADGALVYLERDRGKAELKLPKAWRVLKDKTAGNVRYMLAQVGEDD